METNTSVQARELCFMGTADDVDASDLGPAIADCTPKKETVVVGPVWVDLEHFRKSRNEKQSVFWERFGVNQSAGSRYEKDARSVPTSVRMLVIAFSIGLLDEKDLVALRNAL